MQYSKKLLEHFRHPHNQGRIKNADGVGEVGNIKCGDIMKIYIRVGKQARSRSFTSFRLKQEALEMTREEYGVERQIIKDIKFETLGCAAAIAASSALTDLAKGKTFDEALAITKDDIVKELGGDVPPIKYHCSILAEEGLKKAIENYKFKAQSSKSK